MKHILLLISFTGLLMSAPSFASAGSQNQLKNRISMMMSVAENGEDNLAIKKMIVTGAVKALAESNIKDEELNERINSAVYSISAAFTKRERAILNVHLAKLK